MAKKTPAKKPAAKPVKMAAGKATAKSSPKKAPVKAVIPAKKTVKTPLKSSAKKSVAKAKQIVKKPAKSIAKPATKKPVKKAVVNTVAATTAVTKSQPKKIPAKPLKGKKPAPASSHRILAQQFVRKPVTNKNLKLTPFLTKQRQRLLELKDSLLDAMRGVARDNLHSGSETSAFGMHQADAGSDAYDRDFALGMLSKEQGSLYEIDEALKRVEDGTYGVCEICEKPIRHDRLEALPFTRYTVECQAELEKRQHHQRQHH